MLKACAQLVQKLSVVGLVTGARLYTFIIRILRSAAWLVGKPRVVRVFVLYLSTLFYTLIFTKIHLLTTSYTHNPQPLLLLSKKI